MRNSPRRWKFEVQRFSWRNVRRAALWSAAGSLGVAVLTLVCFRLHLSFATSSFCFLLLLVGLSLAGDFVSSIVVSVLAVGCLDYFFIDPLYSFQVESPLYVVGLSTFLITGLVITRLVTKVKAKTESSRLQNERLQQLYDLAQHLLGVEPDPAGGNRFLEPFLGVFGIHAVCLFDAVSANIHIAGGARGELEERTGDAFIRNADIDDVKHRISVRRVRVGGRLLGAIGFEGLEEPDLAAGPLAALATAYLERVHSFVNASRAAATAQTESYRGAILDALAHEFKTPLSTILAAAGSLQGGSLESHQREMAETVESEAARLGRLTSRLIRTARLEREEVKPWMELIDLAEVIADTVDQYARVSADRRISVVRECDSCEVLADPELLRLAVSQLLDNACKYSVPGSTVTLNIARQGDSLALRVLSSGNPIPSSEKNKIFDRFYRGTDGRRMGPGSGLGLYVARKIALALGGSLDLDSDEPGSVEGTAFRLRLPVPESERNGLTAAI
jgi:two-component system, OmpR family, sensor histidine kinase KdpD